MEIVVVGAGAWGLPAAAELAGRGHRVTLVDRWGVAHDLSSSPGPTRVWRLAHPDRVRVRLGLRSVEAMERLAARSGREVFLRRGLLWRDDPEVVDGIASALRAEGVDNQVIAADDVAAHFPTMTPDGRPAVWQPEAGPVLAAASMSAQRDLFLAAGGTLEVGRTVRSVEAAEHGVRVVGDDGLDLRADQAVVAPGPGAVALLAAMGLDLPLYPRLEQVVHFAARPGGDRGGAALDTDGLPCWIEGPVGDEPAVYAMATPGQGYKVGLDQAMRPLVDGDLDRTPDEALMRLTSERVARSVAGLDPTPLDAQVCSWTEAPDNRFVIDALASGVVLACGDSGEGFKFSALMGTVLAGLAEGHSPDADIATFGLARFADGYPEPSHVLGR